MLFSLSTLRPLLDNLDNTTGLHYFLEWVHKFGTAGLVFLLNPLWIPGIVPFLIKKFHVQIVAWIWANILCYWEILVFFAKNIFKFVSNHFLGELLVTAEKFWLVVLVPIIKLPFFIFKAATWCFVVGGGAVISTLTFVVATAAMPFIWLIQAITNICETVQSIPSLIAPFLLRLLSKN